MPIGPAPPRTTTTATRPSREARRSRTRSPTPDSPHSTYPVEAGGAGLDAQHQKVFDEESAGYEMPSRQFMVGIGICAPTLLEHGTEEQRRAYSPGCCAPTRSGASCSRSRARVPTSPACRRVPSATAKSGWSTVRRCGRRAPTTPTTACSSRAPTPTSPSTAASACSSSTCTRRGSRPAAAPDRRRAHFNEVFLDDVRMPARRAGRRGRRRLAGDVAMLANERVAIGAGGSSQSLSSDGYGSVLRPRPCPRVHRRSGGAPGARRRLRARAHPRAAGHADPGGVGLRARTGPRGLGGQARRHRPGQAGGQPRHGARRRPAAWRGATTHRTAASRHRRSCSHRCSASPVAPPRSNATSSASVCSGLPKDPAVDKDVPFRDLLVGTQSK